MNNYKFVVAPSKFAEKFAYSSSNVEIRLQPSFDVLSDEHKEEIKTIAVNTRQTYIDIVTATKARGERPNPGKIKVEADEAVEKTFTDIQKQAMIS